MYLSWRKRQSQFIVTKLGVLNQVHWQLPHVNLWQQIWCQLELCEVSFVATLKPCFNIYLAYSFDHIIESSAMLLIQVLHLYPLVILIMRFCSIWASQRRLSYSKFSERSVGQNCWVHDERLVNVINKLAKDNRQYVVIHVDVTRLHALKHG